MKRCLQRCLKAGLTGLWLLSALVWAADSPRVQVNNQGSVNKADIHFESVINGDNHMDIVISQGGPQGCPSGQYWDIGRGGCTSAVALRTVGVSQACNCTCPGEGTCSSSQSGSYTVYGWRLPTDGRELFSHNSATSWGACTVTVNNCEAGEDTDKEGPASGTVFIVDALICGASHPNYGDGPLSTSYKGRIISQYRSFNYGSRCPEVGGYVYWQSMWLQTAQQIQSDTPGLTLDAAMERAWITVVNKSMYDTAASNGEHLPSQQVMLDGYCSGFTSQKFGVSVRASYVNGSGSTCVID